jgi:hypothetical protein
MRLNRTWHPTYIHCPLVTLHSVDAVSGVTFGEVGKLLGERWKALTNDEKTEYEDKAKKDKDRYLKEMEAYKGGEAAPAPAAKPKSKAKAPPPKKQEEEEEDEDDEDDGGDDGSDGDDGDDVEDDE